MKKFLQLFMIITISFIHSISYTMRSAPTGLLRRIHATPKTMHAAIPVLIAAQTQLTQRFQTNESSQNVSINELDQAINAIKQRLLSAKDPEEITKLITETTKIDNDIKRSKLYIRDNTPGVDMDSRVIIAGISFIVGIQGLTGGMPLSGLSVMGLGFINFCMGCEIIDNTPDYKKLKRLEKRLEKLVKDIETKQ